MWNIIKETLYIVSAIITISLGLLDIVKRFKK